MNRLSLFKNKRGENNSFFKSHEDLILMISVAAFCIYLAAFCFVDQNLKLTNFLLYISAASIITISKILFLQDHQQLWAMTSCVLGLVVGVLLILGVVYFAPYYNILPPVVSIPKFALYITILNAAIFSALSLR